MTKLLSVNIFTAKGYLVISIAPRSPSMSESFEFNSVTIVLGILFSTSLSSKESIKLSNPIHILTSMEH